MKILFDGTIFNIYPFGGIARIYREILPRIAEKNQSIQFYILCDEDAVTSLPQHEQIFPLYFRSWKFSPISISSRLNARRKRLFDSKIKKFKPQLFHSTYYTTSPCENVKSIATVYDLIDYEFPFMMPNGAEFLARQSRVLSRADHVISISKSTSERAISAFKIATDKVSTIHLDASSIFQPVSMKDKMKFREKYSRGKSFFLFVGGTSSYKNLATLIRAFGIIRERTDHLLLLVGHSKKNIDQQYIDLAIKYQVEDRIIRLIHPNDSILCQAYNAADAFVFPSLQEGFGIPLVEAMRCSTPIIASDIPVFREICGEGALFFNPHVDTELAEQLNAVTEPATQNRLAAAGKERANLFSWDEAAKKVENIYLEFSNDI